MKWRSVTVNDQLHQDHNEELIHKNPHLKQKLLLSWEFLWREWNAMLMLLDAAVCVKWVPGMLSDEMKIEKVCIAWGLLECFTMKR